MNAQHITELARAAKRDGLTLTWSLIRLAERLERVASLCGSGTAVGAEPSAPNELRLDDEALALVLMAVIAAYPPGGDLPTESIPEIR